MWQFDEETVHSAKMELSPSPRRSSSLRLVMRKNSKRGSKICNNSSTSRTIVQEFSKGGGGQSECFQKMGEIMVDDVDLDSTAASSSSYINSSTSRHYNHNNDESIRSSTSKRNLHNSSSSSVTRKLSQQNKSSMRRINEDTMEVLPQDVMTQLPNQRPSSQRVKVRDHSPRSPAGRSKLRRQTSSSSSASASASTVMVKPDALMMIDKGGYPNHDEGDREDVGPQPLKRNDSIQKKFSSHRYYQDDFRRGTLARHSSLPSSALGGSGKFVVASDDGPRSPSRRKQTSSQQRSLGGNSSSSRSRRHRCHVGGYLEGTTDSPHSPSSQRKKSSVVREKFKGIMKKKSFVQNNFLDDDDLSAVTFDTVPSTPDSSPIKRRMISPCDDKLSALERDLELGSSTPSDKETRMNVDRTKISSLYTEDISVDDPLSSPSDVSSLAEPSTTNDPLPLRKKMSIGGLAMELSALMVDDSNNIKPNMSTTTMFQDPPEYTRKMSLIVQEEFVDEDDEYIDDDHKSLDSGDVDTTKHWYSKSRDRRNRQCFFAVVLMLFVITIGMGIGMGLSKPRETTVDTNPSYSNYSSSEESAGIINAPLPSTFPPSFVTEDVQEDDETANESDDEDGDNDEQEHEDNPEGDEDVTESGFNMGGN